jgi:hypothetical protein
MKNAKLLQLLHYQQNQEKQEKISKKSIQKQSKLLTDGLALKPSIFHRKQAPALIAPTPYAS